MTPTFTQRLVGLVLAISLPFAPARAVEGPAYLDSLHRDAVKAGETTVVIYNPNTAANQLIFNAFQTKYPDIKILGVDLFGAPMLARLDAEFASGHPQVDVIYSTPGDTPLVAKQGRLTPFKPENTATLASVYVGRDELWHDWTMTIGGPFYNTTAMTEAEAPTGYADLLDKKWQGRISMSSFRNVAGTGQAFVSLLRDGVIDKAWLQGLADQHAVVTQTNAAAIQNVASGQADIGLDVPFHFYKTAIAKGAPFRFVWPKEGVTSIPLNAALVKDAPHPAAAKLLIAWFFSPDAQRVVSDIGMQGTMPDAPKVVGAPAGAIKFHVADWRLLDERYADVVKMYRQIFTN